MHHTDANPRAFCLAETGLPLQGGSATPSMRLKGQADRLGQRNFPLFPDHLALRQSPCQLSCHKGLTP
jgi:hypothetical protein